MDGNGDIGSRGTTDATGATALGGAVTAEELFPAGWVRAHTEWQDIESMLSAAEYERGVEPDGDTEARRRLDERIAETTEFDSWDEMLERAVVDYSRGRLTDQ